MNDYVSDCIDLKNAVLTLIKKEMNLNGKLDLLTVIELQTSNEETVAVCEAVRHELVSNSPDQESSNQSDGIVEIGQERETDRDILSQETCPKDFRAFDPRPFFDFGGNIFSDEHDFPERMMER